MDNSFLDGVDAGKARWRDSEAEERGIHPAYRWTGRGRDGLEVVFGTSGSKPSATVVREVWKRRHGRRAAPLLVVVGFPDERPGRAVVCGPAGEEPPAVELDFSHAERLARAVLAEPRRELASRRVAEGMEDASDEHPGLRNKGLLATHELLYGVPKRNDWEEATRRAERLLPMRGRELVEGLGYEVEERGRHNVLRSSEGRSRAVAVFLEDSEQADQPSARFENRTPVTYALSHADRDNIPWVVAERSGAVRLYSTSTSGAAGQRGRTETFVEVNLPMLPTEKGGYLPLLFSAEALSEAGSLYEIRRDSGVYASELSERLRERVYKEVVPRLAVAVARRVGGTGEDDLERHYRAALTILFRLMFVAYAEDSRLLPLGVNGEYTRHSLKETAREISSIINAGSDLGFDNPLTDEEESADPSQSYLWEGCQALFRAVDTGHPPWGVPAYNGGLFSTDPEVNPVGEIIEGLSLSNAELGPALTALIVDRSADGDIGPIDFRSLSVREFGTIYEGLLESELSVADSPLTTDKDGVYLPTDDEAKVIVEAGEVYLHNQSGVRKSSGSYFTKPFAVEHLIESSVDPTLKEHLARVRDLLDVNKHADAAAMLFDFRVADIAMGSGHFLTAVVDYLEARYTTFLVDNPIPEVERELDGLREAARRALENFDLGDTVEVEDSLLLRRLVARRCVYGVDVNPLAVEIARVGMWIHTFVPGLPLSFLDHNLACGNSLTGIGTIEEATEILARSGSGQESLFAESLRESLRDAEEPLRRLAMISDKSLRDIAESREVVTEVDRAVNDVAGVFDLIVSARVGKTTIPEALSIEEFFMAATDEHREVAKGMDALHFPVAFPEVFLRERSGFDVLVGNPPWEEATVEKLGFWALRFPGLKSLSQPKQKREVTRLGGERPDIAAEYEAEVEASERLRKLLLSGPYPGMGIGDPDLYKAFAWRFWNLAREGGAVGVVLPRSALSASGLEPWRLAVLGGGAFDDVTMLLNNKHWVFPDVHPQYTVGLVSLRKGVDRSGAIRLRGPYPSFERYKAGNDEPPAEFSAASFRTWTQTASFPLLPSPEAADIFKRLRAHPRLDDEGEGEWRAKPAAEFHATNDKKHMILEEDPPGGAWPVYKGASFDLWNPDTGTYYAWADPEHVTEVLQTKRRNQQRNARSAFSAFSAEWAGDPATLPCLYPRISFRDISRATDTRTVRVALVPGELVLANTAPYLAWPEGDASDEAYLLGVLASVPLDWYARRFVETHVNFHILNAFPIPRPVRDDPLRREVVETSGQLAAVDERFSEWAAEVGVPVGSVAADEKPGLIARLDAAVALLYGLDEDDLRVVYSTFHEGWDYEERLSAVIEHHRSLAPAGVEA